MGQDISWQGTSTLGFIFCKPKLSIGDKILPWRRSQSYSPNFGWEKADEMGEIGINHWVYRTWVGIWTVATRSPDEAYLARLELWTEGYEAMLVHSQRPIPSNLRKENESGTAEHTVNKGWSSSLLCIFFYRDMIPKQDHWSSASSSLLTPVGGQGLLPRTSQEMSHQWDSSPNWNHWSCPSELGYGVDHTGDLPMEIKGHGY